MRTREYRTTVMLLSGYIFATMFVRAIIPTYFLREGLTFADIILSSLLMVGTQLLLLLTIRGLRTRAAWTIAILCYMLFAALLPGVQNPWQFYLASAVSGVSMYAFWVYYNVTHFTHTPKGETGKSSGLLFNIATVLGVGVPLFAGWLAQSNVLFVWGLSILFLAATLLLVKRAPNFQVAYQITESFRASGGVRLMVFLEGLWDSIMFGFIPVATLLFIKTPLAYGAFLSLLALASVPANILLGRRSDTSKHRVRFLLPCALALFAITLMLPFGLANFAIWALLNVAIQVVLPVFRTFTLSKVVDASGNLAQTIPAREILLALGRTSGLLLTYISFRLNMSPAVIVVALAGALVVMSFTFVANYTREAGQRS